MVTQLKSHTRGPDGRYGPTARDHYYVSVYYHRKNAAQNPNKSRWQIEEGQEYEVFRIGDESGWWCAASSALFSIIDQGQLSLGDEDQRLAVFPKPQNQTDSWHGWPTHASDAKPNPNLLDQWEAAGVVDYAMRIKIDKGRI